MSLGVATRGVPLRLELGGHDFLHEAAPLGVGGLGPLRTSAECSAPRGHLAAGFIVPSPLQDRFDQ